MIHKKKVVHLEIISDQANELEAFFRRMNSAFPALRGLEINPKRFFTVNELIVYLYIVDLRSPKQEKVAKFVKWATELNQLEPFSQILVILPESFVTFPDISKPGAYKSFMRQVKLSCRKIGEQGITWYHRCLFKHVVNVPAIGENRTWYAIAEGKDRLIDCDFEERFVRLTLALLELGPNKYK